MEAATRRVARVLTPKQGKQSAQNAQQARLALAVSLKEP